MYGWSIARRLFLAHLVFIGVLTVLVGTAAFVDARDRGYAATTDRLLSVAVAIADNPLVVVAAQSSDPTAALQGYTRTVSERADIDVISVLSPAGERWTHPDPAQIGQRDKIAADAATSERSLTQVTSNVDGPTVRAVVPIRGPDDTVVGLVAAEVQTSTLQTVLDARLPAILALSLTLLLAGSVAIWILGRYLRRVTLGWGPHVLARHYLNGDSVLHSVRDGLVLVDRRGALVLYNDRAAELLGIPPRQGARVGSTPPDIADLDVPAGLAELLASGRSVHNEVHLTRDRVLLVTQEPAVPTSGRVRSRAHPLGTVTTIRDPLDSAGAVGPGAVDDPVIGALLAAKIAQARARGVLLTVSATGTLTDTGLPVQDLVAVLVDLVDTAIDAAATGDAPPRVELSLRTAPEPPTLVMEVSTGGPGGSVHSITLPLPAPHRAPHPAPLAAPDPAPGAAAPAAPPIAPRPTTRVAQHPAAEVAPRTP
jgi:sensor histidine kinase regulating citrate/malate metabolism